MAYLPDDKYKRRASTDTLVIHCAATDEQDFDVHDIREWHVEENGWIDVGYHVVIKRDGTVQGGRPLWAVGAHVEGHNSTSIGVCMVGGGSKKEVNNFTDAQWSSLLTVVKVLCLEYLITDIRGHRDFPNVHKWCPSFDVASWLRENKKKLSEEN